MWNFLFSNKKFHDCRFGLKSRYSYRFSWCHTVQYSTIYCAVIWNNRRRWRICVREKDRKKDTERARQEEWRGRGDNKNAVFQVRYKNIVNVLYLFKERKPESNRNEFLHNTHHSLILQKVQGPNDCRYWGFYDLRCRQRVWHVKDKRKEWEQE